MNNNLKQKIINWIPADDVIVEEEVQSLWSGYGVIERLKIVNGSVSSVVLKNIQFGSGGNHPRGWNTDIGHQRKLKSYQVEVCWYKNYTTKPDAACRIPKFLGSEDTNDGIILLLEDLNASGYSIRKSTVSLVEIKWCLEWLASFHAGYMNVEPDGLWEIGTYWHLETRPNEYARLPEGPLKCHTIAIDEALNECQFKTIVHGDAKLANFCFSESDVAAVDFQYVGGGCGMKDVAYFFSSCLSESECEKYESELLDYYFASLKKELDELNSNINVNALEEEWRQMYYIAWADFVRFLLGWAPGHYKIHSYSQKMVDKAISSL